jgi:hypothetical protein
MSLALYCSRVRSNDLLDRIRGVLSVQTQAAVPALTSEVVSVAATCMKEPTASRAPQTANRHGKDANNGNEKYGREYRAGKRRGCGPNLAGEIECQRPAKGRCKR